MGFLANYQLNNKGEKMNPEPSSWEKKGSKIVFYDNNHKEILRLSGDEVEHVTSPNFVVEDTKGAIFIKKSGYLYAYTFDGELIRKRELSLSERMFGANILDWYKTFAFKY